MAKVGRPRKEDAKRNRYMVRFNEEENDILSAYCKKVGRAKADVIRCLALNAIKKGE